MVGKSHIERGKNPVANSYPIGGRRFLGPAQAAQRNQRSSTLPCHHGAVAAVLHREDHPVPEWSHQVASESHEWL